MEIESDLERFLAAGKQLQYDATKAEAAEVSLCGLNELQLGVVWVSPTDSAGYYEIPAINLTCKCTAYQPEYLLLWLPEEKLYGAWDCDHWVLTVFPETSWSDIAGNPLTYINAQWHPETGVGKRFYPGANHELKQGMPF